MFFGGPLPTSLGQHLCGGEAACGDSLESVARFPSIWGTACVVAKRRAEIPLNQWPVSHLFGAPPVWWQIGRTPVRLRMPLQMPHLLRISGFEIADSAFQVVDRFVLSAIMARNGEVSLSTRPVAAEPVLF